MKQKKNFTIVELLVVISIIGILAAALMPALSGAMEKAKFSGCQGNLSDLGKQFITYSLDEGFFPCAVKDTDTDSTLDRKTKGGKSRSTLNVYNTYREYDNDDIDTKRFFCPASSCRQPRKRTSTLKKSNVSYHYVNSDVTTRIMKGNRGIIRDLNEGHEDAKYGSVLTAQGSTQKIEKIGKETSRAMNYRTNWYKNKDTFENYKDFDNFSRTVRETTVDEVD